MSPAQRREAAQFLMTRGLSQRRSCQLAQLSRSCWRYRPQPGDDAVIIQKLRDIAAKNKRFGYRRAHWELNKQQVVNHKRVQRLWQQAGLQLVKPARRRRETAEPDRSPLQAEHPNHVWTYDFMEDSTADGRTVRLLTLLDEFTRECLAIEAARNFPSAKVLPVLARVIAQRGRPAFIRSDNGSEFIAHDLCAWCYHQAIDTHHIDPGSPWQNGFAESFNGHFRDECLNLEDFVSLLECQVVTATWRSYYNDQRPHTALDYLTPSAFRCQWEATHATGSPQTAR